MLRNNWGKNLAVKLIMSLRLWPLAHLLDWNVMNGWRRMFLFCVDPVGGLINDGWIR